MKNFLSVILVPTFLFMAVYCPAQLRYPDLAMSSGSEKAVNQLPAQFMPVIGVWNWSSRTLQPDGYRSDIDRAGRQTPFNLLIPFLRFPDKEVADEVIRNQVELAAQYAVENNLALVPDIDVRSARRAFRKLYPDELQELLRLKEIKLSESEKVETSVTTIDNLRDHYSGGNIPKYYSVKSSLLRVYAYRSSPEGIEPETMKDITGQCGLVFSSDDSVRISFPPSNSEQTHASALVSFTLFYPDIFAPHLMEFQRMLIRQYADAPLAGVCKDEWGFPPYFPRYCEEGTYDYWYSVFRAQEYSRITGGRDLLEDCLLMARGFRGKQVERQVAVNYFREMSLHRNVALEEDFYNTVKEVFGPDAAVTVHPTWWPYPDQNEMKKNGLDWWAVKRDWAQTDEITPFGARTALCKKWGSPVWYNMYYTRVFSDQVWSSALAGGRLNYLGFQRLFDRELMRAETRIRLLNTISRSPLDCPVAVIFGHAAAMNWAGPHFDDVGMNLVNLFWSAGYPADLIPSSEIENGSLYLDKDGWISYGDQRYAAVILYHPEFEKKSTSAFFMKASESLTAMYRIGSWTRDFYGETVDDSNLLPGTMKLADDYSDAYLRTIEKLKELNIAAQTPATGDLDETYYSLRDFKEVSKFPPTTGFCRLIDGTVIHVAGTGRVDGDTIRKEFLVSGFPVTVDAVGVAAVKLNEKGKVRALAAGSLKSFRCGDFEITLDQRMDVSLWINEKGNWEGVIQTEGEREIPENLREITDNWTRILIPFPDV